MKPMQLVNMPKGTAGFMDPWCLAELRTPTPMAPDPGYNERSGIFFAFSHGEVRAESDDIHRVAVAKDADGVLTADVSATSLPHPPRLESPSTLNKGEYLAVARMVGLAAALAPRPPVCHSSDLECRILSAVGEGGASGVTDAMLEDHLLIGLPVDIYSREKPMIRTMVAALLTAGKLARNPDGQLKLTAKS